MPPLPNRRKMHWNRKLIVIVLIGLILEFFHLVLKHGLICNIAVYKSTCSTEKKQTNNKTWFHNWIEGH